MKEIRPALAAEKHAQPEVGVTGVTKKGVRKPQIQIQLIANSTVKRRWIGPGEQETCTSMRDTKNGAIFLEAVRTGIFLLTPSA